MGFLFGHSPRYLVPKLATVLSKRTTGTDNAEQVSTWEWRPISAFALRPVPAAVVSWEPIGEELQATDHAWQHSSSPITREAVCYKVPYG